MKTLYDVIVIGSGPAGYTSGIYSSRAALNSIIIAGSINAGGELMKTTDVENFPGFPDGIMGPNLITNMKLQAKKFGTKIIYEDAIKVSLKKRIKQVIVNNNVEYYAKAIILATGSLYKKLNIPGESQFIGYGVSYCAVCDGFFFKEKFVTVVGGGDSAMEEALFLSKFASNVIILNRSDKLRASKILQKRVKINKKINIIYNTQVKNIKGDKIVNSITIVNNTNKQEKEINTDGIFVAIGHEPETGLFAKDFDLQNGEFIKVHNRSSKTKIPGVFAAGDMIDPVYRQAITAAASGCIAALDAENYLEKEYSNDTNT